MTLSQEDWKVFEKYTQECIRTVPALKAVSKGEVDAEDLKGLARRFYAEIRTFLDLKLPARMRLCPHDAYAAKKYFWQIYEEEQGGFKPGRNHAQWFKTFCTSIGLTDAELEAEYEAYWPRYSYLLTEKPSRDAVVRELAVSYAWEAVIGIVGEEVLATLKQLGYDDTQLSYFSGHLEVDEGHSALALSILQAYVTDAPTMRVARQAVHDDVIVSNPWTEKRA
ncbi:iron-containing redox enzyme family protein [Streptomyces sp. NPDC055287]